MLGFGPTASYPTAAPPVIPTVIVSPTANSFGGASGRAAIFASAPLSAQLNAVAMIRAALLSRASLIAVFFGAASHRSGPTYFAKIMSRSNALASLSIAAYTGMTALKAVSLGAAKLRAQLLNTAFLSAVTSAISAARTGPTYFAKIAARVLALGNSSLTAFGLVALRARLFGSSGAKSATPTGTTPLAGVSFGNASERTNNVWFAKLVGINGSAASAKAIGLYTGKIAGRVAAMGTTAARGLYSAFILARSSAVASERVSAYRGTTALAGRVLGAASGRLISAGNTVLAGVSLASATVRAAGLYTAELITTSRAVASMRTAIFRIYQLFAVSFGKFQAPNQIAGRAHLRAAALATASMQATGNFAANLAARLGTAAAARGAVVRSTLISALSFAKASARAISGGVANLSATASGIANSRAVFGKISARLIAVMRGMASAKAAETLTAGLRARSNGIATIRAKIKAAMPLSANSSTVSAMRGVIVVGRLLAARSSAMAASAGSIVGTSALAAISLALATGRAISSGVVSLTGRIGTTSAARGVATLTRWLYLSATSFGAGSARLYSLGVMFRKTLSGLGTRVGSRQEHDDP